MNLILVFPGLRFSKFNCQTHRTDFNPTLCSSFLFLFLFFKSLLTCTWRWRPHSVPHTPTSELLCTAQVLHSWTHSSWNFLFRNFKVLSFFFFLLGIPLFAYFSVTHLHDCVSKKCLLSVRSDLWPHVAGRTLERYNRAWKVVPWHKVKPFKPNPLLFKAAFFFHVQICISKCQIWSRSTYSVIDADHRKGGFALLCDTWEIIFFNVWGIYLCLCFALSVTCSCSASGSVNIQAVLARSSYLFSPDQSEFIPFYNRITRY